MTTTKKAAGKSKKTTTRRSSKKEPETLYTLSLTASELEHIRDLFSIMLPSDEEATISSTLAEIKEREEVEQGLWEKIYTLAQESGVGAGEGAPDFVIMSTTGLYEIESED